VAIALGVGGRPSGVADFGDRGERNDLDSLLGCRRFGRLGSLPGRITVGCGLGRSASPERERSDDDEYGPPAVHAHNVLSRSLPVNGVARAAAREVRAAASR
jgi:hypothetical protein